MAKTDPLASVRDTLATLRAQHDAARSRLSPLHEQRADLLREPLHPDDVRPIITRWVDRQISLYSSHLADTGRALSSLSDLDAIEGALDPDGVMPVQGRTLLSRSHRGHDVGEAIAVGALLCLINRDAAISRLTELVTAGLPKGGTPLARRRARLAGLDAEIATLDESLAEMRKSAAAIGVQL